MNPQYMPQQPSQYGGPPLPGYGPPTGNYPQSSPRPSPSGTPGQYPPTNPPGSRGPQLDFGGPGISNGQLDGPQNFPPASQPPHQRGPHTMPPHPSHMSQPPTGGQPNQLANQMSGMNLSGPPRPPSQGFPGAPSKPGLATTPGSNFPPGGAPSSFPPAVNGGLPHLPETAPPPQSQFTNGSMAPPRGPMGPSQGQMPPQKGQMGPQTQPGPHQGPPAHGGPVTSQHNPMGAQQGQFGPPQGQMGPPQSQMGPPQGQMGPPQSQMGPPQGQMGPPQSQMGPPQGQMAPPQSQMGPPQGQMGFQSQPGQGQMRPTPSQMGPPSGPGQMGPPSGMSQMGPPSGMSQMGPPSGMSQMGPPSGMGHMGPPSGMGHMGPPSGPNQMGSPLGPNQMGPPSGQGQMGSPLGPNQMGQMGPHSAQGQMRPPLGPMGQQNQMGLPPGPMGSGPMGPGQFGGPPPGQMGMGPPQAVVHPMVTPPLTMGQPGMYGAQQQPPMNQGFPGYQPSTPQPMSPGQYPSSQAGMQPQQARRLDPDQMPSPIQVMLDDQRNRSGIFYTNQKGQIPPIVTTTFTTQDQGNTGPRFMRSTMYNVPATIDMMKQTAVPFGLVISPLATVLEGEYEPPVVDMGDVGPVRCVRCKAYMCPFMQFIDGGRRFHCLFCKATTEVPAEYFQHLDHTGQRVDRYERPELTLGTYEFVATKDYCRNNEPPKPPAMIFLLDVSYNNVKSGLVNLLCGRMKEIVQLLPRENNADKSNMRVGFITYNNTVHFYNVKGSLAQAQMMVVGDINDMFMPLLDGFLVEPSEAEQVIDSLMAEIPAMFADTRETETLLAPAIQAGLEALKASECSGKLLVFHSSLPIAEAPGKLKNRDDRKLLGTDKEKTVLVPQTNVYNNLGQECVGAGVSVDLFLFNNSYIDIATIGQVSRLTGGEVFKYTYFQSDLDGERLIADIKRDVSRPIAFDAIMRVRTSTGVRPTDFYGHFFMSNTTDMELASIDCDKAVALEIKHDDKLTEEDGVYVQVALLYTSCGGQRRLRVLNLALKTCSQMADLYRSCDLDTIVNFFAKQSVFRLLESSPKPVKDALVSRCAQMLACYRKNCASPSSAGQLILPECMKLLPLYVNCIMKSDAVSGGSEMTLDDRVFVMQAVTIMDIPSSVVFFYPRLLPLIDLDENADDVPSPVRCSSDKLRDDGAYLLENGIHMFLWIGLNVDVDWVHNMFGVHSAAQIDIDRTTLPELDNPLSFRIRSLIEAVRRNRHRCMRLTLVRQRDKMELVFKHFLVEDRGVDSSASYVDFLCHMHKEIRGLLS